ncbi:MAG: hypothetical protein H3C59_10720 [Burkholderiaceae bacterium]|nr:hypothetical protein [Burkholderiaceae bacterium]
MQSQLERAAAAKTDGERRAALADHMRTMQANMMLARGMMMGEAGALPGAGAAMTRPGTMGPEMMGPEMMGPGMMGPGMMGPGAGPGMMSGMMGSGMMCPGMMAHGMMGRGADGSPESAGLQRMERRLDMMQMMIEQMMRSRQGQATPSQP